MGQESGRKCRVDECRRGKVNRRKSRCSSFGVNERHVIRGRRGERITYVRKAVHRTSRLKKGEREREKGWTRRESGDKKKNRQEEKVDFGEAGAYQLRQRLDTKGQRDKRAWVVSLLPVDFIFSLVVSLLPPRGVSLLIETKEESRRKRDGEAERKARKERGS